MRLLMLATEYPPAKGYGLARYASELASALAGLGHEVHVVTANYDGGVPQHVMNGVHVYDRRESPPVKHFDWVGDAVLGNLTLLDRALEVADEAGPFDVIISHDWLSAHTAKAFKAITGVPWVLFMHDTELGKRGGQLTPQQAYITEMEAWAMRHSDRIICCSEFIRTELQRGYGCPAEKIAVVPCGVNPLSFEVIAAWPELRRMFAAEDERLVLFVGRLSPVKDPDLLIEAAPLILRELPNTRFLFCGDGVLRASLEQRSAELGIGGRVTFTGYLGGKALAALYRVADVLVVPSRYEPFGMVALEGAVCGLPVLTSGAGGLAEIAEHVPAVRAWSGNAPEALAEACIESLGRDRSSSSAASTQLPDWCQWPNVAGKIITVLSEAAVAHTRPQDAEPSAEHAVSTAAAAP